MTVEPRRKLKLCYTFCLDDQVVPLTFENVSIDAKTPDEFPDQSWRPAGSQMARSNMSPIFAVGGEASVSLRWVQLMTGRHYGTDLSELARKQLIATVTYD